MWMVLMFSFSLLASMAASAPAVDPPPPESYYLPYLASPVSIWRPSIPSIEQHINTSFHNPWWSWIWVLRVFRVIWVLFVFPLHFLLVTLSLLLPSSIYRYCSQLAFYPTVFGASRNEWTKTQRYLYPLVSSLVWSLPGTGGVSPSLTPSEMRSIPWMSKALNKWGGDPVKVHVTQEDVEWTSEAAMEQWVRGEAKDPAGVVVPSSVPCFWLEAVVPKNGLVDVPVHDKMEGLEKPDQDHHRRDQKRGESRRHERIILYFEGGGYVTGSPVTPGRCYALARATGLKVVGANYRKANAPEQAYPASLQDAITVYAHLVRDWGYANIILAGDSAGGGVAMSLWMYLCTTLQNIKGLQFPLPTHLVLYSPWCDLTLSSYRPGSSYDTSAYSDDFLHFTQLNSAVNHYLTNLYSYGYGIDTLKNSRLPAIVAGVDMQKATNQSISLFLRNGNKVPIDKMMSNGDSKQSALEEAVPATSPWKLLSTHPFFSPSLPSSLPILEACARAYQNTPVGSNSVKLLIGWGTAEIFAPEIENLVGNLKALESFVDEDRRSVVQVETMVATDELHVFMILPQWLTPNAKHALQRVKKFVLS